MLFDFECNCLPMGVRGGITTQTVSAHYKKTVDEVNGDRFTANPCEKDEIFNGFRISGKKWIQEQ